MKGGYINTNQLRLSSGIVRKLIEVQNLQKIT